jgi:pilus assembly protein CpaE
MEACKNAYSFSVIDAPRVSPEAAAALAMASAKTFIVLQPQVKDVRTSRRILHSLVHEHGVPKERLVLVANRFRQRRNALLGLSEAREAVGDVAVECVNNDYDSAVSAINYGLPLSEAAPRSPLRRDLQHLAKQLLAAREPAAAQRRPA